MEGTSSPPDGLLRRCEAAERRASDLERELERVRRESAEELRQARADLALAQRIAHVGTWTLDPEVGVPVWSDEIYEIYERDPALGPYALDDYRSLYSGRDGEAFRSAISLAISDGVPYDIELKLVLPSGRVKWVHALCSPEPDPGPAGHRLRGTIQEITERKERDERLRVSELRYRSLADNFPNGALFLVDREWRFLSANGTAFGPAGLSSQEIVGKTAREVFPELWAILEPNLTRAFEGEAVTYESEYRGRWYTNQAVLIAAPGDAGDQLIVVTQDVTEAKQANAELQTASARLREAIDAGDVGLWDWDLPTNTVRYSDEWKRQIGYASDEIGDGLAEWESRVHPDDLDATKAIVQRTLDGERDEHEVEFRFRHRDGSYRRILARARILRDERGEPQRMLGSHVDITESAENRELLREQRTLLSNAERLTGIGAFRWHVTDGRLEVSQNWLAIHGCSTPPTNLKDILPIAHEDDLPSIRAAFDTVISGRGPYDIEHRIIRQDTGEVRHIRAFGEPVRSEAGDVVAVVGAGVDITEQRRAEAELRESEARFRALLESIEMVSVQGYAPDGTTLYWNRGSERLYGYSAEEAVGRNLLDLIIPDEMKEDVADAISEMARTGTPIPAAELSLQRKDGSRVSVYSSHCIVQPHGRPMELFCIDVDISEIRHAEIERERLHQQLAQAQRLESVGRLAGGIAHDFNNMLGVILGNAELAVSSDDVDERTVTLLREIQTAAERSASLVAQLLAFARRQTVTPKVLDVNDTVGRMLGMLRRFIGEDVSLTWSPGVDLDRICIDPAQLDQVLANLVLNARDAIEGTGRIDISTHARDGGGCCPEVEWDRGVSLSISDDGHGMDEETKARIFDPFFTTKPVGEGTGLGLATVYGIVTQNGGAIEVQSAPGRGTTFTLHFPAAAPDDDEARDDESKGSEELARGTERVLFVEDEVAVGSVVKSMLERLGYTVVSTSNPLSALRIAETDGKFDILVTDVVMPEMNGRDLADGVSRAIPGIVVLFVSGFSANVLSQTSDLHDAVHFLQKPFRMHQLARAIRSALDAERSRSRGS